LRFASQLDFDVEAATIADMATTTDLILTLSQERVTAELDRLLSGRAPGRGLRLLESTGALARVLPELLPAVGCDQNSFHHFDVWEHTIATVEAINVDDNIRTRRWAALLHDIGKPAVRHTKKNGEWGFYKHETAGAEIAGQVLRRLKMNHREATEAELLVRRHMDRPNPEDPRSVRRFLKKLDHLWTDSLALKRADNASHAYDDSVYLDALGVACAEIAERDAARLRAESPLDGNELAAIFRREPGPWIRTVKERLSAGVLEGDLEPGDREAALALARKIMENE
jgi:poly(A) polymerase